MTNSDIFAQTLSYLEELTSDSPLWQMEIPNFLASINTISNEKAAQRESARSALESFIKEFAEENSDRLEWLALEMNDWANLDGLSFTALSEAKGLFESLSGLLDEFDSMPSVGPSIPDTQLLLERKSGVLQRIEHLGAQIKSVSGDFGAMSRAPEDRACTIVGQTPITEIKKCDDATLSKLGVSESVVDVLPDQFSYRIHVESEMAFLDLKPLPSSDKAGIKVSVIGKDENFHEILPSDGVYRVSVGELGKTVMSINVIAENEKMERTYTLIADQQTNRDATLSEIRVSEGEIVIDRSTDVYTLELDNHVDQLTISPLTSDSKANVRLQAQYPSGDTNEIEPSELGDFKTVPLPVGRTDISLVVTAQDPTVSEMYKLAVTRQPASDSSLTNLEVVGAPLEFEPTRSNYTAEFVDESDSLIILLESSHPSATIEATVELYDGSIVSATELEQGVYEASGVGLGNSAVRISVTAEDAKTSQTYSVDVTRRADERSELVGRVWHLLAQDDVSGAYWLTRALESQGFETPVQPHLLLALQGAAWLTPDSETYMNDLSEVVSNVVPKEDDDIEILLGLGAALHASIQAPGTNLSNWLTSPKRLPAIGSVVTKLFEFTIALGGRPLRPELITGDRGFRQLQSRIAEASADAAGWLEESRQHRHRLARANNAWQYLCSEGILNEFLPHVVNDDRDQMGDVRSHLAFLDSESNIIDSINQADRSLLSNTAPRNEITGAARRWLIRRVRDATTRAAEWCELVERATNTQHREEDRWYLDQVSSLREQLQSDCPAVLEALDELSSDTNPPDISAAALCAGRSLRRLVDYLNLRIDYSSLPRPSIKAESLALINTSGASESRGANQSDSLEIAIARRLLWIPSIDLDESGLPVGEDVFESFIENTAAIDDGKASLREIVQVQIEKGDFRFFELLLRGLSPEDIETLSDKYGTEIDSARETLALHIEEARAFVDQASNDGVIEFEGAHWDSFNGEIDDIDVSRVLNFKAIHDSLDRIKAFLDAERRQSRQEISEEWEDQCGVLRDGPYFSEAFLEELTNTFAQASRLDSLDIRVMEDCVSRLRNYGSDEPFRLGSDDQNSEHRWLEDFSSFCHRISDPAAYTKDSSGLKTLTRRQ